MKFLGRLVTGGLLGAAARTAFMMRAGARERKTETIWTRNKRKYGMARTPFLLMKANRLNQSYRLGRLLSFRRGENDFNGVARRFYRISKKVGRTTARLIGMGSQFTRAGRRWSR